MAPGTTVRWPSLERTAEGYMAFSESGVGDGPGLVIVPEIFGLTDHIRAVCDRFAASGFNALGPELYDEATRAALTPERIPAAIEVLRAAPPEAARDPRLFESMLQGRDPGEADAIRAMRRVMEPSGSLRYAQEVVQALGYLRNRREVDPARVGVVGFRFGGGLAAYAAGLDPELRAAVVFYGANPPLEVLPRIRAAMLGLYGADDHRITDAVPAFAERAKRSYVRFDYHVYPGVGHAFFNDTRPETYNAAAAADAWERVQRFLAGQLGGA